jgi:hypothetical protein
VAGEESSAIIPRPTTAPFQSGPKGGKPDNGPHSQISDSKRCAREEIVKPMFEYWVYENWTHKRARLHSAECSFCNHGRGTQPNDSGHNCQWHGPFIERQAALNAMEETKQHNRAVCGFCSP